MAMVKVKCLYCGSEEVSLYGKIAQANRGICVEANHVQDISDGI